MPNEISISKKLEERVKELSYLYEVSSAISKHSDSVSKTLEEICSITKKAWLFPEHAIVQLEFDDYNIFTSAIPVNSVFSTK